MTLAVAFSAAAFASTFSSRITLGDAPESVAGVASTGILHAPGYPVYVLSARLFTLLFPIGSLTFRVVLFSALCSLLVVLGTFRVARLLGAGPFGATAGASALALGASFWFNADFAKHNAFSLLLVVAATLALLEWDSRGRSWLLLVGGGLIGLTLGASWQLGVLATPGLAMLALRRDRGRPVRTFATLVLAGVVGVAGVLAFVFLRASADPVVNWGDARSAERIVDLVSLRDFGSFSKDLVSISGGGGPGGGQSRVGRILDVPRRIAAYDRIVLSEFGIVGALLAIWGAAAGREHGRHRAYVLVTLGTALVAMGLFQGIGRPREPQSYLPLGGALSGLFFIIAVCVAIGASELLDVAASRRNRKRLLEAGIALVVLVGLLAPLVVAHRSHATHRIPFFADDYTANVFSLLPKGATLMVNGTEQTFPLLYRQVVHGERRDLRIVALDGLFSAWYREQLARRLRLDIPEGRDYLTTVKEVAAQLQARGPVYLNPSAVALFGAELGYRTRGLVSDLTDSCVITDPPCSAGAQMPASVQEVRRSLDELDRTPGILDDPSRDRFPNRMVLMDYANAHWELARVYWRMGQPEEVAGQLRQAARIAPYEYNFVQALEDLQQGRGLEDSFGPVSVPVDGGAGRGLGHDAPAPP